MRRAGISAVMALLTACVLVAAPAAAFTPEEIAAAANVARQVEADVQTLASDAFEGRGNEAPGGLAAREWIIDRLEPIAAGLAAGPGRAAYVQPFDVTSANVVAVIPGTTHADEFVVVGAHYDHFPPSGCRGLGSGDAICNGATDNASGVAVVLAIGRALRALPAAPSRSVVLALWDGEESSLLGSRHFVNEEPLVPLGDVAAYVNFDIQGSTLIPSLRDNSFAIGAESGGELLTELTGAAIAATSLDTRRLSVTFGQGRSDYQPFWANEVPVVFFSDATNACYHTTGDEVAIVDFAKLAKQAEIGFRLVVSLAESAERPTFAPLVAFDTYEDLLVLSELLTRSLADVPLLESFWAGELVALEAHARARVDAGSEAFGPTDALLIAQDVLSIALNGLPCDPQLLPEPAAIGACAAVATLASLVRRRRREG